jgi:hypothetical protein
MGAIAALTIPSNEYRISDCGDVDHARATPFDRLFVTLLALARTAFQLARHGR